jgi:WhiB family redox-sensing transcriptional regulator
MSKLVLTAPDLAGGLCSQVDLDLWYPEKGGSVIDAKATCHRCPVEAQCLAYALEHDERFGIWGGMSERERRKLKSNADLAG